MAFHGFRNKKGLFSDRFRQFTRRAVFTKVSKTRFRKIRSHFGSSPRLRVI